MTQYEYDFETVTTAVEGYSLFGGAGLSTDGEYRNIIRRRALDGWRLAACVPTHQMTGGWIDAWDLIFEREL